MRPYIAELSRVADTLVAAYPNAGLPNAMGEYDEGPDDTAGMLGEWARSGLVNILGGCCGTTPDHIRRIAQAVEGLPPRAIPHREKALQAGGPRALRAGLSIGQMSRVLSSDALLPLGGEGGPRRGSDEGSLRPFRLGRPRASAGEANNEKHEKHEQESSPWRRLAVLARSCFSCFSWPNIAQASQPPKGGKLASRASATRPGFQ